MRLSFSLINAWLKGNPNECVECYFRIEKTGLNQAMAEGKKIHSDIAQFITKTRSCPDFLPNFALVNPLPEKELIISYNEMFDVKIIIDCLDIPLFYEWKTGSQDSIDWARTYQIPLYFMVCERSGIKIDSGFLAHYNQKTKEKDFVIIHNSPTLIKEAENLIDSIAPEIYNYFLTQGLI